MEIELTSRAKQDLAYWKKIGNEQILRKIRELIASIVENPYQGIGNPEALKYHLSGKWSRRITQKDRLVYEISKDTLYIFSLKGHYENL
ncbi:MAG: Txe/YoeB family addiction module toxin [Sphingobacteriaceae bacterium]|nr:MAG: Txe/YoeB family addiction module toxin [Sphingobacteriaceae bacterium]